MTTGEGKILLEVIKRNDLKHISKTNKVKYISTAICLSKSLSMNIVGWVNNHNSYEKLFPYADLYLLSIPANSLYLIDGWFIFISYMLGTLIYAKAMVVNKTENSSDEGDKKTNKHRNQ